MNNASKLVDDIIEHAERVKEHLRNEKPPMLYVLGDKFYTERQLNDIGYEVVRRVEPKEKENASTKEH